jgi:urea carboxylase
VSHDDLLQMREDFIHGRFRLHVEETTFRLSDYHAFLKGIAPEAAAFKARQQAAFEAERERWAEAGLNVLPAEAELSAGADDSVLPEGTVAACAPLPANVWKVLANPGDHVAEGDPLVILEAMKMEVPVPAPKSGTVSRILCIPGKLVTPGQALCWVEAD